MGDDPPYPRELERDLTLRDGTRLRLRPIRPDDAPRLQELYGRLSRHTAYQRFFSIMKRLPPDWARVLADVDFRRRLALVAEHDVDGVPELVGVGRYEPTDAPDTAEVAFVVQDGWQDRGLGTVLFREILAAGVARGVRRFRAWVLADNRRMLDLIVRYGAVEQRRTEQGVTELVFTRLGGPDMAPQTPQRS
jgi:RimJ/RimL family protein N-acetyltransferase